MNENHQLLEMLLESFEKKSHCVSSSLLPSLTEGELVEKCSWFPSKLPKSVIELYSWKGGQAKDAWSEEYPFWFRDMSFIGVDQAKSEYESMNQSYGVDNTLEEDGVLLKNAFPFAAFNGGWFVIPSGPHRWSNKYSEPVVYVLQGIVLYYYSLETMLQTCIDSVNHPSWSTQESDIDEEIESNIWQKYNPGVFDE